MITVIFCPLKTNYYCSYYKIPNSVTMRILLIASIFFYITIVGCTGQSHDDHKHHQHNHASINLNHGEKWTVDANMFEYINNMEKDVNNFESSSDKNYAALATGLEENLNLLKTNCTMKGTAHDALHKWLVPYMGLVEELSASQDDSKSHEIVHQLKASLEEFNKYFKG